MKKNDYYMLTREYQNEPITSFIKVTDVLSQNPTDVEVEVLYINNPNLSGGRKGPADFVLLKESGWDIYKITSSERIEFLRLLYE